MIASWTAWLCLSFSPAYAEELTLEEAREAVVQEETWLREELKRVYIDHQPSTPEEAEELKRDYRRRNLQKLIDLKLLKAAVSDAEKKQVPEGKSEADRDEEEKLSKEERIIAKEERKAGLSE